MQIYNAEVVHVYVLCTTSSLCLFQNPHCIALYDYQSGESTDLNFNLGDEIELLEKVDEQWLKGKCGGKTGMFPAGFVEIVVDLPTSMLMSF